MGLSYRLNATNYPWWDNMATWFGNATNGLGFQMGQLIQGVPLWDGYNIGGVGAAATGEVIIRDGYYHNGIYVIVGSYRAYFDNLRGTGAAGFAWDGFVLLHRGYNVMQTTLSAEGFLEPDAYTIIPMLWPAKCAAQDNNQYDDATIGTGLYCVTPLKKLADIDVGASGIGQESIQIVVGGHHPAPPTVGPTDAQTLGVASILQFKLVGDGSTNNKTYSFTVPDNWFEFGYDYDYTGFAPVQIPIYRDWKVVIGMNIFNLGAGASPYAEAVWRSGVFPDGTTVPGPPGPTSSDNGILNNGYLPTKIFGCRSVAGVTQITGNLDGVCYFAGQMASSDPTNKTLLETPFFMAMNTSPKVLEDIFLGNYPWDSLGPWTAAINAVTSTLIVGISNPYRSGVGLYDYGWFSADTTGGVNPGQTVAALNKAAANDILPPSEIVGIDVGDNVSPILLTVGNTEYPLPGNSLPRGALYSANGFPFEASPCWPFGVASGKIETVAGVYMPSKGFTHTLQQFRTYTVPEENQSMQVDIGGDGERVATTISTYDFDTKQFVGWVGNYPRYDTAEDGGQIAGEQSFVGYAAVGYYDGTDPTIGADAGPCLISYDKGTPTILNATPTTGGPPPNPVNQGAFETTPRLREDGDKLNAALGLGGTSALRQVDFAGWDNDRDQWLFIVSETTEGVSIMSVDAPFTTFLNQSAVFSAAQSSDWTTAKYLPISMSNALDGLVVFGEKQTDDFMNVGMANKVSDSYAAIIPWDPPNTYTAYNTAQMVAYRITGSTGRTARVWIDYMLYDGVDAVIATQLRDWGMRVTVENVEWFKARVLQDGGDLKAKGEEIEQWMEEQGRQYQEMLKHKERSGRLRKRRSQVSAYKREVGDLMTPDQIDTEVFDFVPRGIAAQQRLKDSEGALKEVPPDSIEAMVERDYRAGFDKTPSGVTEPGQQLAEDPAAPAGTFMDTGDAPKKAPDEGGDPDEEYISEN